MGCEWECDSGFYADEGGACRACTALDEMVCAAGERVQACTRHTDVVCVACPPPPAHGAHVQGQGCAVSCESGFWFNADTQTCCSNGAYRTESGTCECLPGWVGSGETCML